LSIIHWRILNGGQNFLHPEQGGVKISQLHARLPQNPVSPVFQDWSKTSIIDNLNELTFEIKLIKGERTVSTPLLG